jgi:translation initiation factor IF-3
MWIGFCMLLFFSRRCITISTKELLINDEIKAKEVRLVGEDGQQLGIMSLNDAKEYAYSRDLDLVLMSATAVPPACRAMNYGKYRFERDKREKEAKKKQQVSKLKEVQLSCRIDVHDFETRVNHAKSFLRDGNKVKAVVRFKGREMAHKELGEEVLKKFMDACAEVGASEKGMSLEGRFMSVVLSPVKASASKKSDAN